jgi:hypothetical protein
LIKIEADAGLAMVTSTGGGIIGATIVSIYSKNNKKLKNTIVLGLIFGNVASGVVLGGLIL